MLWLLVSPHVPNLLSNEPNPGWSPARCLWNLIWGQRQIRLAMPRAMILGNIFTTVNYPGIL